MRSPRKLFDGLGIAAIACERLWLISLTTRPRLALHLASLHLAIWPLFIGVFRLRKVRAVVMGAASGYLLIGCLGAFLLHNLLLWRPEAFAVSQLAPGLDPVHSPLQAFPAMVIASFGALTTTGGRDRPAR